VRRLGALLGSGLSDQETASTPGIDKSLEVVADAQGKPSFGDILADDELIELSDDGFGSGDRGEACLFGRALGRWDRLGNYLGEGSVCAKGTNADGWLEAAFKERDIVIEAERAAGRFVGHGDTVVGGVSGPLMWSNISFVGVGSIQGLSVGAADSSRLSMTTGALLERCENLRLTFGLTVSRPVPLQNPLQRSFTGLLYKNHGRKW
jgi:hypothetical protein